MKKIYFLSILFTFWGGFFFAQYSVDFEDGTKASYATGNVTLNGIDWEMADALIGNATSDYFLDTKSARLRGYGTSALTMLQDKANGIGNISFNYRSYGTGSETQVDWKVEYSTDGGTSWTQAGATFTPTGLDTVTFSANVNVNATNSRIRIVRATATGTSNARLNIDNIIITDYGNIITQNDTTVNFTTTSAMVLENAGTYKLNLKLNQAVGMASSIDVALFSGPSANLSNSFPSTVSFAAGNDTASLVVSIIDDAIVEPDDTFYFILQNASSNLIIGSDSIFTLIAEDDDTPLPIYTIGQVNTVDVDGNPDSLNVDCEIQNAVVMGINYADAPDVSFYIHDATGGMGVYNPMGTAGYTVNEGDLITVKGTVGFFNGLTQLVNITSITVTGTGSLPSPNTLTTPLAESDESELVRLSNVTVVAQTDWNTGVGSGFTVDVTDGTNTYAVRIDKSTDLYNMALPGCVLDVTGIGSQFDNSSPYTSGYQLLPRYAADITVIEACVTPSYTIADATGVDANGAAVLNGTVLSLKGIITSPDFRELQANGTEFSFSDGTGGIWAFTTDSTVSFNPVVGDSVIVYGNIGQSSGVTRIYIDSVMSLGAATPLSSVIITSALAENHEAELVTIEHLTLSSAWQSSGPSYNVDAVSDGGITYSIRVDADRAELFTVPLTTANKFTLTGVGTQYDPTSPFTEGYQILPRFASDIDIETAIKDITLDNMSVSPIPADNILNVAFNYHTSETVSFEIIDVLGHVVLTQPVALTNGYNKNTLDVSTLSSGFYVLKIQTTEGVSTTNVMIK